MIAFPERRREHDFSCGAFLKGRNPEENQPLWRQIFQMHVMVVI